jgi:23S rRNA (adenine2503-C2)-methyltransferase
MAAQVYAVKKDSGKQIGSIVLMGCGEPLDNFDNTIKFLRLVSHPTGMNLGLRNIVLSTCGLVPEIRKLAAERLPITLAISLHAPNDGIRTEIMPIARKYSIADIMDSCIFYTEKTKRRITYEYTLMQGINDSDTCAHELGRLLRGQLCHLNILPVNSVSADFKPSKRSKPFKGILERYGVPITIRHSLGSDIEAACGQLRRRYIDSI